MLSFGTDYPPAPQSAIHPSKYNTYITYSKKGKKTSIYKSIRPNKFKSLKSIRFNSSYLFKVLSSIIWHGGKKQ